MYVLNRRHSSFFCLLRAAKCNLGLWSNLCSTNNATGNESMQKFDAKCGLSKKIIGIIKYNVKKEILRKLPVLPDPVETKLFLEGRDAWVFGWCLLNENCPIGPQETVSLEVEAKLKRGFHGYQKTTLYKFSCHVQIQKDIFHPVLSVAQI